MATTVSYGTVVESTVNGGTLSPAIPGSSSANSILLAFVWNRSAPTAAFTETGAGAWTLIFDSFTDGATTAPSVAVFVAPGTETTAPTLAWVGQAIPVCAVVARVDGASAIGTVGAAFTAGGGVDDYTVGPIADPTPLAATSGAVLCFALHRNLNGPCTSAAISANSSGSWVQGLNHFTSAGADVSAVIYHTIYTSGPTLADEVVTFSGGVAAGGQYGRMLEVVAGQSTITGSYDASPWAAFGGTCSGTVQVDGDYSAAPWAAFAVAASGSVSVSGAYAATWDDFAAQSAGSLPVTGAYSATWASFTATYQGVVGALSSIVGQYGGAWAEFGGTYSGSVTVVGSSVAAMDKFSTRYRATLVQPVAPIEEIETGGTDLTWTLVDDGEQIYADLALNATGTPVLSSDLRTAVILSIGSDARATDDDFIPDGTADRRGYWGDEFAPEGIANDRYGSRRWLLAREKQTPAVLKRVEEIDRASLQWMIDDGIAESIDVVESYPRIGWLLTEITIHRPKSPPVRYRFDFAWDAQARIA